MKILAIGNSFSDDATRYLYAIARADGAHIEVANLYIGGCSLALHHKNMLTGERAYTLEYNGHMTGFPVSLEEGLTNRAWDIVTIQQASHESFNPATYTPYGEALADYIRTLAPTARLIVHQTWAYEKDSERLHQIAGYDRAEDMLGDIVAAYAQFAARIRADGVIPSGEMLAALLQNGVPRVHRDTFHASLGVGRYALGLLWYRSLTGKSVAAIPFRDFDEAIDPKTVDIIKATVDSFASIPF
ncbi:MAG: DUF4886 domain-containing protein [Clostridia bacterium]|nr:DUF4886 domain-containing protein [Clostridia bacterium]